MIEATFGLAIAAAAGIVHAKIEADKKDQREENRVNHQPLAAQMKNAYAAYEGHLGNGDSGPAIVALRNYIALLKKVVPPQPDQEEKFGKALEDLVFKSQERAMLLSRAFKANDARLEDEDPFARHAAHLEYIEKLKSILPEDDAFLIKEISDFDRAYPAISIHD